MAPPCRYHEDGIRCPRGLTCRYYHNPLRGAALIRCQFYDHGHCRFGRQCQFLHSDEKHPACHFYARGRCRNGDTCKFSHAEEVVAAKPVCHFFVKGECKNGDTCRFLHQQQEEETIDSPKALVIFLERLSHHKGARFCLEALLKQKESVRDFLGDLGFCDITKLYSILDRCGKVDDKKEYEELISTLGRSLVMKSLFHIGYITRETDLIVCTKVLVDAARLGRGCDWGLPIALLRRRIKELKIDSELLEGLLMRLGTYRRKPRPPVISVGVLQRGG